MRSWRRCKGSPQEALRAEAASHWDLLEAAFAMHLPVEVLGTDEHMLYRTAGYERIDITATHPVLHGYQNGLSFSCDEPLAGELIHVDHVIPRAFFNQDEIWNLVLAHRSCNLEKNARLPFRRSLQKLYERNEYYKMHTPQRRRQGTLKPEGEGSFEWVGGGQVPPRRGILPGSTCILDRGVFVISWWSTHQRINRWLIMKDERCQEVCTSERLAWAWSIW